METDRRDFIKAGTAAMLASGLGFAAAAGGRPFKRITIAKTSCQFEREPMVRPFGFK